VVSGRRLLGALLLVLSFVPIFRILDAESDNFRRTSVEVAEATLAYVQSAAFMAVLLGIVLAFLVPRPHLLPALDRLGARLEAVPAGRWAGALALLAFLLAAAVNALVYQGLFTNVDEIASFIQARYFAAGTLAGVLPGPADAWLIPNMLTVDAGWVSQFPPSHLALLAAGIAVGAPTLVGPVLFAMLAGFAAAALVRLLPDHPRAARTAGLTIAISPFLVLIGAGGLSHTSAGAFLWLSVWAALRARDGGWGWAVAAGAAIGVAVCSRPWIGVLLGTLGTLGVWLPVVVDRYRSGPHGGRVGGLVWLGARCAATVAGGLPFAIALGWYNTRLFGSARTLGYLAAFGERHRLGFHPDPWGNEYTILDAVGFTSTDLIAFGTQLLETPIPLGAAVGVWLLLVRRLPRGTPFLLAWALIPVLGNVLYWFHSTRMLYEAAPAWLALGALSVAPLLVAAPGAGTTPDRVDSEDPPARRRRLEPAGVALWTVAVALLLAAGLGVPDRFSGFAWDDDLLTRLLVPQAPGPEAPLVFVHTSWNERLSSRLQGAGEMRQDSVISLLRRNTNCSLHQYALARERRAGQADPLPEIDLSQRPGTPPDIVRPPTPEGTTLRAREGERFPATCQRELNADRFGAVALAPLLWQGDLPQLESGDPLFVRDFGPEANAPLVDRWPERTPWVFVPRSVDGPPELVAYDEAMRVLWGGPVGDPAPER
jgi:hypothetical protein